MEIIIAAIIVIACVGFLAFVNSFIKNPEKYPWLTGYVPSRADEIARACGLRGEE